MVQPEADGTGGALRAAREVIADGEVVLVLSGDHPLVSAEIVSELIQTHRDAGAGATVMTTELENPGTYGRIVRGADGGVERIVEAKEAGDATLEELQIKEINAGTYAFSGPALADALGRLSNDNAQGEYYLGDVLPLIRESGLGIAAYRSPGPRRQPRRQRSGRPGSRHRGGPPPHPRRPHARRGDGARPELDLGRRGRRARPRRHDRAGDDAARRDRRRRRLA